MLRTRIFATIVISTILIWLFTGNPDDPSEGFLKCPLHWLTGLQCPFCGSQRAIHHLMHLHFSKALSYNPWLVVIGIYAVAYSLGHWRSHKATLVMLVLTMTWGIIRNTLTDNTLIPII